MWSDKIFSYRILLIIAVLFFISGCVNNNIKISVEEKTDKTEGLEVKDPSGNWTLFLFKPFQLSPTLGDDKPVSLANGSTRFYVVDSSLPNFANIPPMAVVYVWKKSSSNTPAVPSEYDTISIDGKTVFIAGETGGISGVVLNYYMDINEFRVIIETMDMVPMDDVVALFKQIMNNWQTKDSQTQASASLANEKTEFDTCGKKEKYQGMPWWNKFKNNVEQSNFYSDNYIESRLQEFHNNEYSNPSKKYYAYDEFCANYKNYDICVGRNDKLLVNNEVGNDLEGCLSKDGALFIAVFPGIYFGGGNYIFRYDIKNNILEEAKRINEKWGEMWVAVPREFLKREGNVIKMKGVEGDAGGGVENDFDYNFIDNQVKLTKSCMGEGDIKKQCTSY